MSEVGRVHGPGGSEPGAGRKDRTKLDDTFTKIMEVGNIDETDPHKKKGKQKAPTETKDVEEGLKAASGPQPAAPNVKPIEKVDTPLAIKKSDTTIKLPTTSTRATNQTPLASFNEQEIEKYAWEEDALTATDFSGEPSQSRAQEGYTQSYTSSPSSTTSSQPEPSRPSTEKEGLSMQTDRDFEEAQAGTQGKYQEEWPQTASYSPSSSFRSYSPSRRDEGREQDYPPVSSRETRPSRVEYTDRPKQREQKETHPPLVSPKAEKAPSKKEPQEEEEKITDLAKEKKTPAQKGKEAPPPPGTPVLPGQKGAVLPFAAHMETEEEIKESTTPPPVIKTPASTDNLPQKLKSDLTPKAPSPVPSETAPAKVKTKEPTEEIPIPLSSIPAAGASFSSLKRTTPTTISSKKEKEEVEVEGTMRPPPLTVSTGQGTDQSGGQGKKKREGEVAEEIVAISGAPVTPASAPPSIQAAAPLAPTPYAQMDPQIMAMFERMVGVMTIAQTTGISETTMTLNARQFAASVLYGSKIVIREFSTAPKAFNVEFIGSPQAIAQVQQNIPSMLGAIQQGKFNFTINRFDVKLGSTEKPIFSRKGTVGDRSNQDLNDKDEDSP